MNELELLKKEVQELRVIINALVAPDKYIIGKDIKINDGRDIVVARGTGTRIGTEATQKLSVYGEVPVVQAASINAPNSPGASYAQSDAQSTVNAVNSILTALRNFGIIA